MNPDREIDLLERQNPVREDEVPVAQSPMARALRERIVLEDPDRLPGRPRARWSRPLVRRLAAIGVSAIAITFGLALLPGDGLLPGDEDGGPTAVERAIAAIQRTDEGILHMKVVYTAVGPASQLFEAFDRMRFEVWQSSAPPYQQRATGDSPFVRGQFEFGENANGLREDYDPRRNTVTVEKEVSSGGKGESVFESLFQGGGIRASILELLGSGKLREDGRTSVDGREAIRIVSTASGETLIVDAESYELIEFRQVFTAGPCEGTQTLHFKVFELLPPTEANLDLVSVRAQHPDARVIQAGKIYTGPSICESG